MTLSLPTPAPVRWQQALALALGSVFLLWHSLVLLIGCSPASYVVTKIYPVFAPYIEFLHLDSGWAFFAPDPTAGRLVRYNVQRADGLMLPYRFTESLQRTDPAYLRMTTLSAAIKAEDPEVVNSVAQRLCRIHAAERPQSIHFTLARQMRITPEEYEAGQRPLDTDFLNLEELPAVRCKS